MAVDWEAMEPHWRAGIKSKLELSKDFGVSRAAMDKHFGKMGIERDLTARIQAKADALVTKSIVTPSVTQNVTSEREIVEANAVQQASIRMTHRAKISEASKICEAMLGELGTATEFRELIMEISNQAGESEELSDKAMAMLRRAMELPGRASTLDRLVVSLKTLVGLERQAYGIDEDEKTGASIEDLLDKLPLR
jgi:hypothetical protein